MKFKATFLFPFLITISVIAGPKPGELITSGSSHRKAIALTFDDGPGPETDKFLALLDRYQVKATFFVLGELAGYHPQTIKSILARGNEVGSHTLKHINYKARLKEIEKTESDVARATEKAKDELIADMRKSDLLIQKGSSQKIIYCRMPHGIDRPWIKEAAKEMGYTLINWTYGADWSPEPYEKLLPGYIKAVQPGAIFLFHDGGKNRAKSLALAEAVIKEAQSKGYEIVPVGTLISHP